MLLAFGFVALLVGCKPGTPSEYIQPDDMEDILVDYHMARAMAEQADGPFEERSYRQALYVEAVMKSLTLRLCIITDEPIDLIRCTRMWPTGWRRRRWHMVQRKVK